MHLHQDQFIKMQMKIETNEKKITKQKKNFRIVSDGTELKHIYRFNHCIIRST